MTKFNKFDVRSFFRKKNILHVLLDLNVAKDLEEVGTYTHNSTLEELHIFSEHYELEVG